MGIFLLSQINEIQRINVGIYRDDGLLVTPVPPRQAENIKKKICKNFPRHELAITANMKGSTVDFLDVTFDLKNGSFKPYNKPGNIPQYVHRLSNHPPTIIKNIPEGINRRLSSISSSP